MLLLEPVTPKKHVKSNDHEKQQLQRCPNSNTLDTLWWLIFLTSDTHLLYLCVK
jgi:hypothetical protein